MYVLYGYKMLKRFREKMVSETKIDDPPREKCEKIGSMKNNHKASLGSRFIVVFLKVDGRKPAPPDMYVTLQIIDFTRFLVAINGGNGDDTLTFRSRFG